MFADACRSPPLVVRTLDRVVKPVSDKVGRRSSKHHPSVDRVGNLPQAGDLVRVARSKRLAAPPVSRRNYAMTMVIVAATG